jgi:hypothetical protein
MIQSADRQLGEIRHGAAELAARIAFDAARGVETREATETLSRLDRLLVEGEERRSHLAAALGNRRGSCPVSSPSPAARAPGVES